MRTAGTIAGSAVGTIIVAFVSILGACGSSTSETMRPASGNIAGEGTVGAKVDDNGNTAIHVRVKHLAPPSRVAADSSVYVVWIRPGNGQLQNVGALELDDELVGELKTTSPHRSFTLTVTPEPSARMAAPTHTPVFTSDVNLD
jgi:hypothetical protein